jgi:hypothetical protein
MEASVGFNLAGLVFLNGGSNIQGEIKRGSILGGDRCRQQFGHGVPNPEDASADAIGDMT